MTADTIGRSHFEFGGVLGGAFNAVTRNLTSFFLLGLLLNAPPAILLTFGFEELKLTRYVVGVSALGAGWLLSFVCSGLLQASVTLGVASNARGESASLRRDLVAAGRRILPLTGINAVIYAVYTLYAVALIGPNLVLIRLTSVGSEIASGMAFGVFFLGTPVLVWFIAAVSVAAPSLIVEGLGPIAALRRSLRLTRGYRWPIIGAVVLIGLLILVVEIVTRFLAQVAALATHVPESSGVFLIDVVIAPITGVLFASLISQAYFELRRVKEGVGAQPVAAVFD